MSVSACDFPVLGKLAKWCGNHVLVLEAPNSRFVHKSPWQRFERPADCTLHCSSSTDVIAEQENACTVRSAVAFALSVRLALALVCQYHSITVGLEIGHGFSYDLLIKLAFGGFSVLPRPHR